MRPRQTRGATCPGYSLVETAVVAALFALLLVLTIPALSALPSAQLNASGRELADFLHHCRSRAIAKRSLVRVGFVVSSPVESEPYRRYAAWEWDKTTRTFSPFTSWHTLPSNVVLAEMLPKNAPQADYVRNEPSSILGDWITSPDASVFREPHSREEGEMTLSYLDFTPSGKARCDWGEKRNLLLCLVPAETASTGEGDNWVQFSIDTLTGRARVYRP
jgi:hypothetical protein